jgi:hypothetical protein
VVSGVSMRKYFVLILSISIFINYGSSVFASDKEFNIEEPLKPIPSNAIKSISDYESNSHKPFKCLLIGKSIDLVGNGKSLDIIATTKHGCQWAANAAPVWVLRHNNGNYSVVLCFVTDTFELMDKTTNGLRKIKTMRGSAGYAEVETWDYNGKIYNKSGSYYFRADDDEACRKQPDLCPFDLNR